MPYTASVRSSTFSASSKSDKVAKSPVWYILHYFMLLILLTMLSRFLQRVDHFADFVVLYVSERVVTSPGRTIAICVLRRQSRFALKGLFLVGHVQSFNPFPMNHDRPNNCCISFCLETRKYEMGIRTVQVSDVERVLRPNYMPCRN